MTGEVVAFVFGRRTHQTFRQLINLLKQANMEIIRWIADSRWRAAAAGLFRLFRSSLTIKLQIVITES